MQTNGEIKNVLTFASDPLFLKILQACHKRKLIDGKVVNAFSDKALNQIHSTINVMADSIKQACQVGEEISLPPGRYDDMDTFTLGRILCDIRTHDHPSRKRIKRGLECVSAT